MPTYFFRFLISPSIIFRWKINFGSKKTRRPFFWHKDPNYNQSKAHFWKGSSKMAALLMLLEQVGCLIQLYWTHGALSDKKATDFKHITDNQQTWVNLTSLVSSLFQIEVWGEPTMTVGEIEWFAVFQYDLDLVSRSNAFRLLKVKATWSASH